MFFGLFVASGKCCISLTNISRPLLALRALYHILTRGGGVGGTPQN